MKALISAYNKDGIIELAGFLHEAGWEILSTGGTARYLKEYNLPVADVSQATGFPECLDGRVKTLHPVIHAGLLAKRDDPAHTETLKEHAISPIDLVCVNLYPFFEKAQADLDFDEMIEFIDIGGPAMLRSAAKNCKDVLALTDPADYAEVTAGLKAGVVPFATRKKLAGKVFALTSAYDAAISRFLLEEEYPAYYPLSIRKAQQMRYGENGHQSASLYFHTGKKGAVASMTQLHGKELSYNNVRDLDVAWKAVCSFGLGGEKPFYQDDVARLLPDDSPSLPPVCCVAVKHNTPCGISLGGSLAEAYEKTYACDPVSIFGGIVACNAKVDTETAVKLNDLFLEIVVAPDFDEEALAVLKQKKNVRIMKAPLAPRQKQEFVSVDGGILIQSADQRLMEKWDVVTELKPEKQDLRDMIFGMQAVAYVKSNAILIAKNCAAVGMSAGETNRIWAVELALSRGAQVIENACKMGRGGGEPARVLASDAFFPFPDVVEAAAAAGIKTIIQPGGSVKDSLSIKAANDTGIAMVFTGTRHFKH
ncbi:MAG: bifunctional phosphoribosylaminoimidazolecarboxamide formyltransferase/IMP cyclohydrolase [Treponema sp.]|jgi:phosphoribosylaminoimidazolecarboxamide formyltransferase/IMP cyclohydrolase|nr:bifunctional phosphoribosylaminoimidazolecarboxamide formyltransferase/IMP cyclohydrolase [Treponema sp.]